jgi:class 3 adenylate cyclase/DNA-binding NarL/FixJ family response regulator
MGAMADRRITVFLADDNLIVREGVRALIGLEPDLVVVGAAADYDGLVSGAEAAEPQVVVTDIRMPPTFQLEGIDAAKEIRKRHPGTGVVILSQYDDPEYAISLLGEGSAGYAYLLKDRLADGDQLAKAIREVATGGSLLDPSIVKALVNPVTSAGGLTPEEEELLGFVAEGRPVKAIAASQGSTGEAVADAVERLFLKLAQEASTGASSSLRRLRMLHQAIILREEQGEKLSRLLPGGLADKVRQEGRRIGETELLDVTVLISDIRGYSGIAEHAEPSALAGQLNEHRAEMNGAVLAAGGTVMQFVGDSVMAVFGAPLAQDDHARHSADAACAMHVAQEAVNERWVAQGLSPFTMGIGLSTGRVAAALLGSEERVEYSLVGDAVNLAQRLQQLAEAGQTVVSQPTADALGDMVELTPMEPVLVKGRDSTVYAYLLVTTASRR